MPAEILVLAAWLLVVGGVAGWLLNDIWRKWRAEDDEAELYRALAQDDNPSPL